MSDQGWICTDCGKRVYVARVWDARVECTSCAAEAKAGDAARSRCTCRRTLVQPHPRTIACRNVDTLGLCVIPPGKSDR